MSNTQLNMTVILCQKLKNQVGQGTTSAYQVSIARGESVGRSGFILDPQSYPAVNEPNWCGEIESKSGWFSRCLKRLRLS